MNIEYHTINELEWRCTEEREEHMGIVNVVCSVIGKMYTEKKVAAELESIKKASGLKEQDWNAIWESISHYPEEVQTVLEAKNEDHVRLYDKDKQDVWAILDETKQLIDKEVPELFWLDFFNTIQLYTCQPIEHIYTTERVKKWSMGDLRYCIHNFLYDLYNILLLLWRHPNLLAVICEVLLFLLLSFGSVYCLCCYC